jgi:hypothetical protein
MATVTIKVGTLAPSGLWVAWSDDDRGLNAAGHSEDEVRHNALAALTALSEARGVPTPEAVFA